MPLGLPMRPSKLAVIEKIAPSETRTRSITLWALCRRRLNVVKGAATHASHTASEIAHER